MTTRQRIFKHLKKIHSATAREIARALNLSAPNVRHHLGVLASDGRVEAISVRRHDERGRPEKMFSLSQAALGDNLPALTEALLVEAGSRIEWDTVARKILGEVELSGQHSTAQLRLLVEELNAKHYQCRWEASAEGPRVIFGRCPYAAVIERHVELCQMDASLLEVALEKKVRQLGKIEKGQGVCIFAVQ